MRGWTNLTREDEVCGLYLIQYFGLTTSSVQLAGLEEPLERRGLCQADVVLALLRGGYLGAAGRLTGRAVTRLPPDARFNPAPMPPAVGEAGPRVVAVRQNPILPTTPMHQRYKAFRVGRTLEQLLARGLTRRDVAYAERLGYVVMR